VSIATSHLSAIHFAIDGSALHARRLDVAELCSFHNRWLDVRVGCCMHAAGVATVAVAAEAIKPPRP
jgi:hypothetical protein